ncbi:MAG TPA: YraN family protein [Bryobacteraceae bacterium]|nr:YraN family protein [Bryobacteraceae bacterium]
MLLKLLSRNLDGLRHRLRLAAGDDRHALGRRGEDLAHRYLQSRGLKVIGRNFRTRNGSAEVDLIAAEGQTIVFVEVKTRSTSEFGTPEQAVDTQKQRRILRAAAEYLRRRDLQASDARFDIVSVVCGNRPQLEHFRDAFRPAVSE